MSNGLNHASYRPAQGQQSSHRYAGGGQPGVHPAYSVPRRDVSNWVDPTRAYGSSTEYLPAKSVASNYTVPTSAASVVGYRSTADDGRYNAGSNGSIPTDHSSSRQTAVQPVAFRPAVRPYVPRQPRPTAPSTATGTTGSFDNAATGLAALVSASEATETFNRRTVVPSSSYPTSRQGIDRPAPAPVNFARPPVSDRTVPPTNNTSDRRPPVTHARPAAKHQTGQPGVQSYTTGASRREVTLPSHSQAVRPPVASTDEEPYPVAPSPAYDPVAFERIIGLSSDVPPVKTPRPFEAIETGIERGNAADKVVDAQRHGIAPSLSRNEDSDRLQALVKATEPGQLEAWQTEQGPSRNNKKTVAVEEPAGSEDGAELPPRGNTANSSRGRVRKPRPKKGEPGYKSRVRRSKADIEAERAAAAAATITPATAADHAEEASPGPFTSLTAHLAAYSQRDKALQREEAGYGRIPDIRPEDILKKRQEVVAQRVAEEKRLAREEAQREAQRKAMLEDARPDSDQGGHMDIDLSGFGDIDAKIDEQADYEAQRQARIAHNHRIMAALGLGDVYQPPIEEAGPTPIKRPQGRPAIKKLKRMREPRYSPDGTSVDPCATGQRQRLAYVEMPHIFRSRRVQALFRFVELLPVPENPIDAWSESEESSMEVGQDEGATCPTVQTEKAPVVHYSEMQGDVCHQCRRKSTKPKMSCRNKDPLCNLKYCNTCVQRYNFPFEEYSRTFICPRCQGYCNCSACLRSSGLLKLLKLDENQDKLRMSLHAAKSAPNVQVYLEMMGAPKAPPMPQQELHRIRFIHKDEDIVTPEIPDDVLSELMSRHRKRKHYAKAGVSPKKAKKPAKKKAKDVDIQMEDNDGYVAGHSETTRPKPRKRKGKENADKSTHTAPTDLVEDTVISAEPSYAEQQQPDPDSSDLSDDEEMARPYYDPQYGYQPGDARRPASTKETDYQGYRYAIANAWSVYRT